MNRNDEEQERILAEEYKRVLMAHGRRVANRWAAARQKNCGGLGELADFFAQYGSESELPKTERSSTDMIDTFDPSGLNARYVQSKGIIDSATARGASEVFEVDRLSGETILHARWPMPGTPEGDAFFASLRGIKDDE